MASAPKIPVKKSDGTTVYMTLDEFKAYRAAQANSATVLPSLPNTREKKLDENVPESVIPSMEDTSASALKPIPKIFHPSVPEEKEEPEHGELFPMVQETTALSNTTPVKDIFLDKAMAQEKSSHSKMEPKTIQGNASPKEGTSPKSKEDILSWKARERKEKPEGLIRMQEEIKNSIKQSKTSIDPIKMDPPQMKKMEEPVEVSPSTTPVAPPMPPMPEPQEKMKTKETKQVEPSLLDASVHKDFFRDVPQHVITMGSLPDDKMKQCDLLVQKLSFIVDKEVYGRFCSLLQTRLKGIRTNDQFLEYAMRKPIDGGIGLTADQVREVITLIDKNAPGKDESLHNDLSRVLEPAHIQPKVDMNKVMEEKRSMEPATEKPVGMGMGKPMIRDVHPVDSPEYMKKSVGPLDELKTFSLTDLRRLAQNPSDCVKILHQKIQLLQNDSYLLYLDGIKAWKESPLYKSYQDAVLEGLRSGQNLETILSSKESTPTMEEVAEIIGLNKKLSY